MIAGNKVAVVGCGVSGLAAIKACLEEGLEPTCFEMKPDIGGLWYPTDDPKTETGPYMYPSLITNTSKAMMCFSDFPCPAEYPPYLPHRLYLQYLHKYAEHFGLRRHIFFNTKVLNVRKHDDYNTNGRWVIVTEPVSSTSEPGKQAVLEFDGVMLCQGFLRIPHSPKIPRMESFKGRLMHAAQYRGPETFRDRTVIVVGNYSSAGDIAVDVADVAKEVYLSIGDGAYNISRLHNGRTPLDFRICRAVFNLVPASLVTPVMIKGASNWLDPVCSGLEPKPSKPLTQVRFIINDELPFKIMCGQVKVVGHLESLEGNAASLEGGTTCGVDDVIFATGYKHDFHVIDPSIISPDPNGGKLELYKMVFPICQSHNTLALIGCLRANGPIPPILESQARLAARVMARRHNLPDQATMLNDVDHMNKSLLKTHGHYHYAFHYLPLTDSICTELGVKPVWWRLLLYGDFKMVLAVLFGPAYPFHYRLVGPGAWSGAREAIFRAYKETVFSVQHRKVEERQASIGHRIVKMCVVGIAVFAAYRFSGVGS